MSFLGEMAFASMSGHPKREPEEKIEEVVDDEESGEEEDNLDPAEQQRVRDKASAAKFAIESFYDNFFRHRVQREDR